MLFKSPYPLDPPKDQSLHQFLFKPVEQGPSAGSSVTEERLNQPLLWPTPAANTPRPDAKPLSLTQARSIALNFAAALLDVEKWGKGDVLAIYASNQHDYLVAALGVLAAGGSIALCNPSYKPEELAHQLRMVKARTILTTAASLDNANKAAKEALNSGKESLPGLSTAPKVLVFEEKHELSWYNLVEAGKQLGNQGQDRVAAVKVSPVDDTAMFCFSSGTSGAPKAVRLSHANLVANMIQATFLLLDRVNEPLLDEGSWYASDSVSEEITDSSTGERIKQAVKKAVSVIKRESIKQDEFHLDVLPYFHCYALLMGFIALHTGTPRVILPRFQLDVFLSAVQDHKITFAFVVPPILLALAKSPEVEKYNVSSLKRVASGAASLPEELQTSVYKRLGIKSTDGYGMSEMSPIISMQNLKDLEIAPRTVGVLAPGTEAKVVGPNGEELGPDQEGELWLRGPQMMQGYLANDEANRNAFVPSIDDPDRFLRTGDVVKISSKGYVTITDRLKDVIKYHGFQVSPSELEGFLFQDTRIADCAVLGVVDPKDGSELPWAFVVASNSVAEDKDQRKTIEKEILDSVNSKVAANYKKLRGLTWIEALPKSASGKILKKDLRALNVQEK